MTESYLFRPIYTPLPQGWRSGHWQVEAHRSNGVEAWWAPVGIAWLNYVAPRIMQPVVDYVLVADQFRRQGVAVRLLAAIFERWPDALLTDPISPAGARLVSAFERHRLQCVAVVGG